ncbi:hypothetical protein [Streptomyces chartreusis]
MKTATNLPQSATAPAERPPFSERAAQLAAGTYDEITICVYEGRPAAAHQVGQTGNRFGLCASCAVSPAVTEGGRLAVIWHSVEGADQEIADETERLIALHVARRRAADQHTPARSGPIDETEDEWTSHAAFAVASDALSVALAKSPNRAETLAAMRSLLNLHAAEARA